VIDITYATLGCGLLLLVRDFLEVRHYFWASLSLIQPNRYEHI